MPGGANMSEQDMMKAMSESMGQAPPAPGRVRRISKKQGGKVAKPKGRGFGGGRAAQELASLSK